MRQGLDDKLKKKKKKGLNLKKVNFTYLAYDYSNPRGKDQK